MQRNIILILTVSLFCSPLIASAYAGQIQSQQFSQDEAETMETMEIDSAPLMASIEGGDGDDALVAAGIVLLILCLLAAAATA